MGVGLIDDDDAADVDVSSAVVDDSIDRVGGN